MSWSCLHVFYGEPQDALLRDAVAPLVAGLRREGLQRWFFLRYWMGGPHVRLRLVLDDARREQQLEALRARLSDHVARNPAAPIDTRSEQARQALASLAALEGVARGSATDGIAQSCVRVASYEPEHAKYGGPVGVALAEALFETSSDLALAVVAATSSARKARLGQALEMMLAAILAAGHDAASCCGFLAEQCALWSRYVSPAAHERWARQLPANLPVLAERVERLLPQTFEGVTHPGHAAQHWACAVRATLARVDARASEVLPHVSPVAGPSGHERARDFLLLSYLHTHNNRLGIIPAYEAYLAYLGHHAVSACLGRSPVPSRDLVAGSDRPPGAPRRPANAPPTPQPNARPNARPDARPTQGQRPANTRIDP